MTAPTPISPADGFLSANGFDDAVLTPLVADASPRRYFRLEGCGLLLMEDRTDLAGCAAYLHLSAHLNARGLSAPRVLASDVALGLALVEDFGDATYTRCLSEGQNETQLYQLAVDALLHLHQDPAGPEVARPHYDLEILLAELDIFTDWFVPAVAPSTNSVKFCAAWRALWREALAPVAHRSDTFVLRDFHVDNLMLLPDRAGVAQCGLLDFQDGLIGPSEYDLVSLLQDARRDLTPGLEELLLERYIARAPDHLGPGRDIRHRYALLGAQRHARILGVFVRLCQRNGKRRHLSYLSRVLNQFITAMATANLHDIKNLLDRSLPGWTDQAVRLPTSLHSKGASDA